MDASATKAVSAYTQALERAKSGAVGGGEGATGDVAGGGFGAMLRDQIQDVIQTGKVAEKQTIKAASGKADLVDVVQAVNNAEMALQTVVAVRDRMVQAYQEIMRMPI